MLGKAKTLKPVFSEGSNKDYMKRLEEETYQGFQYSTYPSPALKYIIEKYHPDVDFDIIGSENKRNLTLKSLRKFRDDGGELVPNFQDERFYIYMDFLNKDKPGTFKSEVEKISHSPKTSKKEGSKIIDEAIEEVEKATKKKRKPAYNRKDRPMPMMTKTVIQKEIRPHEYHRGTWDADELVAFYDKYGYIPPTKAGKPRSTTIEKLRAKIHKREHKLDIKNMSRIKFPGPWRRHVGRWSNEEMLEYYEEWGVIPPTTAGKERALTIKELMDKINGIKRPKTYGLMSTKEVSGPRVVKEKKKKHKEPEPVFEEPKRPEPAKEAYPEPFMDSRKLRAHVTGLYDTLRHNMTEKEQFRYIRLLRDDKWNEAKDFLEDLYKTSQMIF